MSTGRIQFFMTSSEFLDWLGGVARSDVRLLQPLKSGGYSELHLPTETSGLPRVFFIAAMSAEFLQDEVELAPGADWVRVVPPRVLGDRLYIGDASPARKDSARRLFTRLRKSIRVLAPFGTYAINITTQKSHLYSDIRSTRGVQELAGRGVELCQDGVDNIRFQPEST